ncbi:hypothetical protein U1701_01090 [Sphingomonas sp. PB2P19]|uniref:hypothetical protein n=1 Tax=Sphingomonas rhamnosi TaxID=3096156 RepID=UPI002FC8816A
MVRTPALAVLLQTAGVVIGLAGLALAPPASGRMLLVPLTPQGAADLIPLALRSGGLLLGAGPLPHSYVVVGDGARLAAATAGHAIVRVAAPAAGCGDVTT